MRLNLDASAEECRRIAGPIRDKWRVLRPEWRTTDSPLKYVDWAMEETIAKSQALCRLLRQPPDTYVAELGPGACYLAYMLGNSGCEVTGYDLPDRPLYRETAEALDVFVENFMICPDFIPEPGADLIVATQISWLDDWTPAQGRDMVARWLTSRRVSRIVLFPNPKAFGGADPGGVWQEFRPVELTMPYLGRGFIFTR